MNSLHNIEGVVKTLHSLIFDRDISPEPPKELLKIEGFEAIYHSLLELRKGFISIGSGELTYPITGRGYLSSALKELQASMQHLTWQTKAIAAGDFTQSVDFMGEFSEAFNHMTKQLESTLHESARKEEILRKSEERYRMLAENITDVIWILDPETMRFLYISPSVYGLRGYTPEEIMSESLNEALTPEGADYVKRITRQRTQDFLSGKESPDRYYIEELEQPCKDGTFVWTEVITTFYINEETGRVEVRGVTRNISQRKKKEEEILYLSYHDQLTGLYNRRFYEEELKRLDTERNLPITLIMADVNGLKLTNDAFGHLAGDRLIQKIGDILKEECRADDIIARIGGDEFVVLLPKTNAEGAEKMVQRINQSIDNQKNDHTILSVSFGWATKHDMHEEIAKVYTQAEDYMYRQKLSESAEMKKETIKRIITVLHENNEIEKSHCINVSEFCKNIGIALGLSSDEVNELETAGLLHDIGKIGIDEKILNKPGKFTDREWVEMKRHSEIGYQILKSVNQFAQIAEFVLAHHERLDGRGYPKGIKGNEIPLQSKILFIADAYDAIISERTYKDKLSEDMAIQELKKNIGIQFDDSIAQIFVEDVLGKKWN